MLKRPDQIAFGWAHFDYLNWAALTVRACGTSSSVLVTYRLVAPSGMVVGLQLDGLEHRFAELLEEVTVPLLDDDVFLFYTDGLSEAMNADGDLFGEERLRVLVEDHGGLGSDGLRERIVRETLQPAMHNRPDVPRALTCPRELDHFGVLRAGHRCEPAGSRR